MARGGDEREVEKVGRLVDHFTRAFVFGVVPIRGSSTILIRGTGVVLVRGPTSDPVGLKSLDQFLRLFAEFRREKSRISHEFGRA